MSEQQSIGDVIVERTPNGVCIVFPPRPVVGRTRAWIGAMIVAVCMVALGILPWGCVAGSAAPSRSVVVFGAILTTLAAPILACLHVLMVVGRSEIAVVGGEIVTCERLGIFSWVRRRPIRRLRRLEITTRTAWLGSPNGEQQSQVRTQRELLWALRGYFGQWDAVVLALGYPRAMLEQAAQALSELTSAACPAFVQRQEAIVAAEPRIEIVAEQDREPRLPNPRSVRIASEGRAVYIEFLPPPWAARGGCGMLMAALFAAAGAWTVFSFWFGDAADPNRSWLTLVCPGLFLPIGLFLMVVGLLELRQSGSTIEVFEGTVWVTEPGLLTTQQRYWWREELAAIRCIRDSDGPHWLRFDLTNGRHERFSSGHGLDWVAWRLRQALQLPEVPP